MFLNIKPQSLVSVVLAFVPPLLYLYAMKGNWAIAYQTPPSFFLSLPILIFVAVAILGKAINQSRIVMVCLLFSAHCAFLSIPSVLSLFKLSYVSASFITNFSLFASFSALLVLGESRIFGPYGFVWTLAIFIPPVILWDASQLEGSFFRKLYDLRPLGIPSSIWPLPEMILIPFFAFILVTTFWVNRSLRIFSNSLVLCSFPIFVSEIYANHAGMILTCYMTMGSVLLFSVLRMYWNRVYMDELTSLPNRRALDEKLQNMDGEYLIAMVDIDKFKDCNDNYGHTEGDNVLRCVAGHLEKHTRGRVFRYGGEEFTLIFENGNKDEIVNLINNMRESLADRKFFLRGKDKTEAENVQLTISIGLAESSESMPVAQQVIEAADQALLKAKEEGRNRLICA